jgi:hypothetical protein
MDVSIDLTTFREGLDRIAERQLPYAVMRGLNTLVTTVQDVEREHVANAFTLRRPDWFNRSIKVTHFATKQTLVASIGVHPPGGDARADILGKFEDGGVKRSVGPHGLVAIPIQVKGTKSGLIPDAIRPKNLNLRDTTSPSDRMLGKGYKRTFIVQLSNGDRAIFQRIGTRSRDKRRLGRRLLGLDPSVVLLYYLKPSVPIAPELQFHETAIRVTNTDWSRIFAAAWQQALATAR